MKKSLIYAISFLVVVFLGVLVYQASKRSVNLANGIAYKIEMMSYESKGKDNRDTYTIKSEYPIITDGIAEDIMIKINRTLEASVRSTLLAVKKDFEQQYGSVDVANTYIPVEPLTYDGQMEIATSTGSFPFLNVVLTGYQYSGGAHGLTVITTFVFDRETGDQMTFDNLFSKSYLTLLSEQSLAELRRIDPSLETFSFALDGTAPQKENFKAFTLEPDGMHIIFQNYQVGPYVIGNPEITIPYTSIRGILRDRYADISKLD